MLALFVSVAIAASPTTTEKEARALMEAFLKPGADIAALSQALAPTLRDYEVFVGGDHATALKAFAEESREWQKDLPLQRVRPGQTLTLTRDPEMEKKARRRLGASIIVFWVLFASPDGGSETSAILQFINGHWVLGEVKA